RWRLRGCVALRARRLAADAPKLFGPIVTSCEQGIFFGGWRAAGWRLSCFGLLLKISLRHGSHLRENSARAELLNFVLDATELATQPAGYWVLAHVFDSFALCA
ncbi:hypothetical protein, partial [Pseudomonas syringae group genomosp. 3]|uniref:hypothetical protein n=1 Tax=Pseudomonas syringae group genomosp. 3 TaxID=251701 RepID=UPI001C3F3DE1